MAVNLGMAGKFGIKRAEANSGDAFVYVSVEGTQKSGKTHFACGFPGPICYLDFDRGLDRTLRNLGRETEVWRVALDLPMDVETAAETKSKSAAKTEEDRKTIQRAQAQARQGRIAERASEQWERFRDIWREALQPSSGFGTVVVDTASELWELCVLAKAGKLTQIPTLNWGPIKAEFRAVMQLPQYQRAVNVVLLHHLKDEYTGAGESAHKTGKLIKRGLKEIDQVVETTVRTMRKMATRKELEDGWPAVSFNCEILDCGVDKDLNGVKLFGEISEAEWDAMGRPFPEPGLSPPSSAASLGMLLYPEVPAGHWGVD